MTLFIFVSLQLMEERTSVLRRRQRRICADMAAFDGGGAHTAANGSSGHQPLWPHQQRTRRRPHRYPTASTLDVAPSVPTPPTGDGGAGRGALRRTAASAVGHFGAVSGAPPPAAPRRAGTLLRPAVAGGHPMVGTHGGPGAPRGARRHRTRVGGGRRPISD